jgi:hypothetical protein
MRRACSTILFFLALAGPAMPVASQAQVICTGNASPPPELPVYEQPPCTRLHLGPRLLEDWPGWILLGSGHLGAAPDSRLAVDTGLLGLA